MDVVADPVVAFVTSVGPLCPGGGVIVEGACDVVVPLAVVQSNHRTIVIIY